MRRQLFSSLRRAALVCVYLLPLVVNGQDAKEIVRKADQKAKGKSTYAEMTIRIERPTWNREMKLRGWSLGNDMNLIQITAPPKDKGTAFLRRKKEVWNWIPSIERTIKLPPSMMSQSWMGTDFTNDDLVKEASIVEDYEHFIKSRETIGERLCYRIELIPKEDAAVVWGKVVLWIDDNDNIMLKAEYYDEEGELVNTMKADEVRMLGGKLLPSRMEMTPSDKQGNKTILTYQLLQFDINIKEEFFNPQQLQKLQ